MIVRNVRDISPENRRSLESMLGEPLREDQKVCIAIVPVTGPDEDVRRAAFARIEEIFARTDAYAREQGITEKEIDEAVEEAMQHVRHRSS